MIKILIEILKGAMIGIANIVPGLSGGTLAVVMNIYDKLIDAISNIVTHPIKAIKSIWIYVIGIVIGIVFGVFAVTYLLNNYEIPTTFMFVGLIIGAVPLLITQINQSKITKGNVAIAFLMGIIVISLPFLSSIGNIATIDNPVIYFILGAIAAGTMVIPGVSGSMVLMTLGYYDKVMDLVKNTITAVISLDVTTVLNNMIYIIPLGIGILLGIILIAKVIKYLFNRHKQLTIFAILGLVIASPFAVITEMNTVNIDVLAIVISVITFGVGYKVAEIFGKLED